MRLSELIQTLQKIQTKEGDLLVFTEGSYYEQGGGGKSLTPVETVRVMNYDYKKYRVTYTMMKQLTEKENCRVVCI